MYLPKHKISLSSIFWFLCSTTHVILVVWYSFVKVEIAKNKQTKNTWPAAHNCIGGGLMLHSTVIVDFKMHTFLFSHALYAADEERHYLGVNVFFFCAFFCMPCVVWLCAHTRRLDCTLAQSESVRSFHCQLWESCINLHVFPQHGAIFELGSHWYRVYPGTREGETEAMTYKVKTVQDQRSSLMRPPRIPSAQSAKALPFNIKEIVLKFVIIYSLCCNIFGLVINACCLLQFSVQAMCNMSFIYEFALINMDDVLCRADYFTSCEVKYCVNVVCFINM